MFQVSCKNVHIGPHEVSVRQWRKHFIIYTIVAIISLLCYLSINIAIYITVWLRCGNSYRNRFCGLLLCMVLWLIIYTNTDCALLSLSVLRQFFQLGVSFYYQICGDFRKINLLGNSPHPHTCANTDYYWLFSIHYLILSILFCCTASAIHSQQRCHA